MNYELRNKKFNKCYFRVYILFLKFYFERVKMEYIYKMFGLFMLFYINISYGKSCIVKKLESLYRELIDLFKVIYKIYMEFENFCSIFFIIKEEIWMLSVLVGEIKCFDYDGICRDRILIKLGEWFNDIVVVFEGNLVYIDGKLYNVNKVVDGQIDEIIKLLKWIFLNLCYIIFGDFFVVFIDYLGI